MDWLQRLPEVDEVLELDGWRLTVVAVRSHRIETLYNPPGSDSRCRIALMHGSLVRGSESIWASSCLRRTLDIRLRSMINMRMLDEG